MFEIIKKRVQSHVLEKVIGVLMAIFGIAAIFVFINAMLSPVDEVTGIREIGPNVAMIEILMILVIAVLGQTIIMIRIYEQHEK